MIIFNQPRGIGDVIFIQSIANDFIREGQKVIIPVPPDYLPLQKHFPNVVFLDMNLLKIDYEKKIDYIIGGGHVRVIPLRFAESIQRLPYKDCMKAKYSLLKKDFHRWREMTWVRHPEQEQRLFSEVLGLKEGEKFNLVNANFRFDNSGRAEIKVDNGLKNVEMKVTEGFTLLDWGKVLQNATTIHQVSSATFYLTELMELKATELHLYVRKDKQRLFQEKDFSTISYLFSKKYELHF